MQWWLVGACGVHGNPKAGGNSFFWVNVTNVLIEGVAIKHFDGSLWIHFAQNITVRNVTLFNRNVPEETGNIEVGGMGSHGTWRVAMCNFEIRYV